MYNLLNGSDIRSRLPIHSWWKRSRPVTGAKPAVSSLTHCRPPPLAGIRDNCFVGLVPWRWRGPHKQVSLTLSLIRSKYYYHFCVCCHCYSLEVSGAASDNPRGIIITCVGEPGATICGKSSGKQYEYWRNKIHSKFEEKFKNTNTVV